MEKKIVYYGVYYATNGQIMLTPGETQEECLQELREQLAKEPYGKYVDFCKATTVIKRDLSTLTNPDFIFGNPKSLNVLNEIKPTTKVVKKDAKKTNN